MSNHVHNWMIEDTMRYRDPERNEYIQDTYACECGAGGYIRTPKELFDKGMRNVELEVME